MGGVACHCHLIRSAGRERATKLDRVEILVVRKPLGGSYFLIELKDILELNRVHELANSPPIQLVLEINFGRCR